MSLLGKNKKSLSERVGSSLRRESWELSNERALEEIQTRKAAAKGMGMPFLKISDGDSVRVRFLDENPVVRCYQHTVKKPGNKYRTFTCQGRDEECLGCDADISKSFRAVYRVFVEKTTDRKGKTIRNGFFILTANARTFEDLQILSEKKGLKSRWYEINRTGEGFDTKYTVIPDEPSEMDEDLKEKKILSKDEIKDAFRPLGLREQRAIVGGRIDAEEDD